MKPVKLFVDPQDLADQRLKVPILYPFSGIPSPQSFNEAGFGIGLYGVFERYCAVGKEYFTLTSLDQCDYIVFPYEFRVQEGPGEMADRLAVYAEYEKRAKKPVLLFYSSDPEANRWLHQVPFENPIVFASSLFKSGQPDYLHAMPAFVRDPETEGFTAPQRSKGPKPVIGFCGFAAPLGVAWGKYRIQEEIRLLLDQLGLLKSLKIDSFHTTRVRVIKRLMQSSRVQANFIIRSFSAFDSSQGLYAEGKEERTKRLRKQYFDNILESDYVVCSRGHGNFSYRFYETLACGRIPVYIQTDSALPFDNQVDWQNYCVWVNEWEVSRIDKIVADFHNNLSAEAFLQLQADCRKAWEEYLSPEGFYRNLAGQLQHHAELVLQ